MRIYREVDVPDTLYISEAVCWIAFGWPPGEDWTDTDFNYLRTSIAAIGELGGASWRPDLYFSRSEVLLFLPGVDPDEYEALMNDVGWTSFDDIEDRASQMLPVYDRIEANNPAYKEEMDEAREAISRDKDSIKKLAIIQRPAAQRMDIAFSDFFKCLASGSLSARGAVLPENPDEDIFLEDISPEMWSISGSDYKNSTLAIESRQFVSVQIDARDFFLQFSQPSIEPISINLNLHGRTLVGDDGTSPTSFQNPRTKRSRSKKMAGAIEKAVQNEFSDRFSKGQLTHDTPRESVKAEVVGWVQKTFNESIGLETARRYLIPIYERAYTT